VKYFLNSYTPLIASRAGQAAVLKHGLPPYIDGSCRREPDLESAYPSITAVCRGRIFVPRLSQGDTIVYLTKKGSYSPLNIPHWRLVAILQVRDVKLTHADAAKWYQAKRLPLPNNCLIADNPPVTLDKTVAASIAGISDAAVIKEWDKGYQDRVNITGRFVICDTLFCDLHNPPVIKQSDLHAIFGKTPNTRIPLTIQPQQFGALKQLAFSGRNAAGRGQRQSSCTKSGTVITKCFPRTKKPVGMPKVTLCGRCSKGKRK
jgi:hypothetical protein